MELILLDICEVLLVEIKCPPNLQVTCYFLSLSCLTINLLLLVLVSILYPQDEFSRIVIFLVDSK